MNWPFIGKYLVHPIKDCSKLGEIHQKVRLSKLGYLIISENFRTKK